MSVEINLLSLQAQPEMPKAVPTDAKTSKIEQTLPEEDQKFAKMIRDLMKEAKEKGKSPDGQVESILAGLLTAFPQLPNEAVLKTGEGEVVNDELIATLDLSLQPALENMPGAVSEPTAVEGMTPSLSGAEDLMATAESTGSNDDGLSAFPKMVSDVTTLAPKETADATEVMAGFREVAVEETIEPVTVATGERVDSPPVELLSKQELNRELAEAYSDLVTQQSNTTVAEGELAEAGTATMEMSDETGTITPVSSATGKEMKQNTGEPARVNAQDTLETIETPRQSANSSFEEMNFTHSETNDGAPDFAKEMETLGLSPETERESFLTVKKGVDQNDLAFHQVEAAPVVPIEPVEQLESTAETVLQRMPKEEVVAQVIDGAKLMVKNGVAKIQLQLEPAELGKLELSLIIERDLVAARFVTETQGVQSLIEANLPQLRSALQEAGLRVDLLQVGVQTGNQPPMQDHSSASNHRFTQSSPALNGTAKLFTAEDSLFTEDSWHGLVNMRV